MRFWIQAIAKQTVPCLLYTGDLTIDCILPTNSAQCLYLCLQFLVWEIHRIQAIEPSTVKTQIQSQTESKANNEHIQKHPFSFININPIHVEQAHI